MNRLNSRVERVSSTWIERAINSIPLRFRMLCTPLCVMLRSLPGQPNSATLCAPWVIQTIWPTLCAYVHGSLTVHSTQDAVLFVVSWCSPLCVSRSCLFTLQDTYHLSHSRKHLILLHVTYRTRKRLSHISHSSCALCNTRVTITHTTQRDCQWYCQCRYVRDRGV